MALTHLQISTVHTSAAVTVINTAPPELRMRKCRARVVFTADVDKYLARPPHPLTEAIPLKQYFQNFTLTKEHKVRSTFVGKDGFGNLIYTVSEGEEHIVRFTEYHPTSQPEAFFYNILLEKVPFRCEAELLSPENVEQSYLVECKLRNIINDTHDLMHYLQEYSAHHLLEDEQAQQMFSNIMSTRQGALLADPDEDNGITATTIPPPTLTHNTAAEAKSPSHKKKHHTFSKEFQEFAYIPLNNEQQQICDAVLTTNANSDNMLNVHVISGVPGAGKTFLAKKLAVEFEQRGKTVLISASTGAAAVRLSERAQTIHKAFMLPVLGQLIPLRPNHIVHQLLAAADVIFLDEYSMVTANTLNYVVYRLQQICTAINKPLSSKTLVLFGDPAQLPPICRHHKKQPSPAEDSDDEEDVITDICSKCHISASVVWPHCCHHYLSTSMRHAGDPAHIAFLNIIRQRKPTAAEIMAHLGSCFITIDDALAKADHNTTFLCTHRADVTAINAEVAQKIFPDTLIPVPLVSNADDVPELQTWLADSRFHTLTHVALGAHVMLTTNIDLTIGAANGATGVVSRIKMHKDKITRIDVTLPNGEIVQVQRSRMRHHYGLTPGKKYTKRTFPLSLAYAMTGHKCQGATIRNNVILFVRKAFCPSMMYVMLSRVLSRMQISIINSVTPDDFLPMPATYLPTRSSTPTIHSTHSNSCIDC